jgi:phosphoserine phosphatase
MRLILARHGETKGNVLGINEGQMQGELTANGRTQARQLGKRLSSEKIDAIYVSDLRRCVQTAEHVVISHPYTPIFYESLLRERSLGNLEGLQRGEVRATALQKGQTIWEYKPEGGESIEDVKLRVKQFVQRLRASHAGHTVLIVSHGQFIVNLILHVMKLDDSHYDSYTHDNTAVTIMSLDGSPKLDVTSCTIHLNDIF